MQLFSLLQWAKNSISGGYFETTLFEFSPIILNGVGFRVGIRSTFSMNLAESLCRQEKICHVTQNHKAVSRQKPCILLELHYWQIATAWSNLRRQRTMAWHVLRCCLWVFYIAWLWRHFCVLPLPWGQVKLYILKAVISLSFIDRKWTTRFGHIQHWYFESSLIKWSQPLDPE